MFNILNNTALVPHIPMFSFGAFGQRLLRAGHTFSFVLLLFLVFDDKVAYVAGVVHQKRSVHLFMSGG